MAQLWRGPIILTGHSKGGNLAVYAAMNAEDKVKDRIEHIYSLDGPGFPEAVVRSFEYASVHERITKIVPDSSVVGMVLETPERCHGGEVRCGRHHAAFRVLVADAWRRIRQGRGCGEQFRDVQQVVERLAFGAFRRATEHAVDALFSVLAASGADNISGMVAAGPKVIPDMLGTYVDSAARIGAISIRR